MALWTQVDPGVPAQEDPDANTLQGMLRPPRAFVTVALAVALTGTALSAAYADTGASPAPSDSGTPSAEPTDTPSPAPSDTPSPTATATATPSPSPSPSPSPIPPPVLRPETVNKTLLLGYSARGVPLYAYRRNAINSRRRVLVLGSIHGDEAVGRRVALALRDRPGGFARDVEVWLIPTINPDGVALRIRRNARGVDLNRNFPYAWRYDASRRYYSGPTAASEPETRALLTFLRTYHPRTEIIFHQPLRCIDVTTSTREASTVIARNTRLPLCNLGWRHGSQATFAQRTTPGSIALTIELPATPSQALLDRAATGIRQLANLR